jgi:hypothetical protein
MYSVAPQAATYLSGERSTISRRMLGLLGAELGPGGRRQPAQVGHAVNLAGVLEPSSPEARRLAGVGDDGAQPLVLQGAKLVARQAPERRVVGPVVRERGRRHGDTAVPRSTGK